MEKRKYDITYYGEHEIQTIYYFGEVDERNNLQLYAYAANLFPLINFSRWNKRFQEEQKRFLLTEIKEDFGEIIVDDVKIK